MAILNEAERIRELRTRVVRADRAYVCCRSSVARLNSDLTALLTAILSAMEGYSADKRLMLALVPGPLTSPLTRRIVTITEGELAVGMVVLIGATELAALASTLAAYDLIGNIGTAIGTLLGSRDDGCYECMKKQALTQENPRVVEIDKHRTRRPG